MTDMNIACFLFKGIVKQKPKQLFHIPLISAAVFFDPDKSLLLDSPFINRFECKSINFIFSEIFIFNFCSFQPMILDWTSQVCMKEFDYGKMFIDSCERSTFLFTGFLMLNEIRYKLFKISLIAASFWKDNLWMIESKAPYYFCLHYLPLLWLWNPSMVNFLPHWSFVFWRNSCHDCTDPHCSAPEIQKSENGSIFEYLGYIEQILRIRFVNPHIIHINKQTDDLERYILLNHTALYSLNTLPKKLRLTQRNILHW